LRSVAGGGIRQCHVARSNSRGDDLPVWHAHRHPLHEDVDAPVLNWSKAETVVEHPGTLVEALHVEAYRNTGSGALLEQFDDQARTGASVPVGRDKGDIEQHDLTWPAMDVRPSGRFTVDEDDVEIAVGVVRV